jgi:hypothetical protein
VGSKTDERTGNVWVLDTETKGTGANMVPLERVLKRGSETVRGFRLPPPIPPEHSPAEQREPYRFKIVDLMTRQVRAEDVDARRAVEVLGEVRSIVDVNVYVWDTEADRWRRLTFGEAKDLWDRRPPAR